MHFFALYFVLLIHMIDKLETVDDVETAKSLCWGKRAIHIKLKYDILNILSMNTVIY